VRHTTPSRQDHRGPGWDHTIGKHRFFRSDTLKRCRKQATCRVVAPAASVRYAANGSTRPNPAHPRRSKKIWGHCRVKSWRPASSGYRRQHGPSAAGKRWTWRPRPPAPGQAARAAAPGARGRTFYARQSVRWRCIEKSGQVWTSSAAPFLFRMALSIYGTAGSPTYRRSSILV